MSDNQISTDDFHRIAHLSRLPLKPEDDIIASQLSQAAEYVDILKELDTDKIDPTYQVNHKKNVLREDVITPSFPQNTSVSQSSKNRDGYFVTSATIQK